MTRETSPGLQELKFEGNWSLPQPADKPRALLGTRTLPTSSPSRNNSVPGEWQHLPAPAVSSVPQQGNAQSSGISNQKTNTENSCKASRGHFPLCHLKDQAVEHDGKGSQEFMGAVQRNCSELEGLSNALLLCANSTDL